MQKLILGLFFIVFTAVAFCQTPEPQIKKEDSLAVKQKDTTSKLSKLVDKFLDGPKKEGEEKAKIQDYLIISSENDTTHVDTTLTIHKDYKFNYLRRDNFGLIPFSNIGQTYNSLTYNFQNTKLLPSFGATARHFNYMEIEDIFYYRVPTPLTELLYRSALEQGQLADSFFTVNTSPQLNFSIAYKGLRSLGKYQQILTSTGNFRFTTNYSTKNDRYVMRGHVVMQDLLNRENGGLRENEVELFEQGDVEFLDRSLFELNFQNAESVLKGKRFHLDHAYNIVRKDTTSSHQLRVGHIISFEDKFYQYDQRTAEEEFFGEAFSSSAFKDLVTLERLTNQLNVNYSNSLLGDIQLNLNQEHYNYGYNKVVVLGGNTITNRLKGDVISAGGTYKKAFKKFKLYGDLGINVSGDFTGNYIKGEAEFKFADNIFAKASINHSSRAPNFNALLYQSNHQSYNWRNNFNNIETQQLAFQIKFKELLNLSLDFNTISDYVYFKQDENATAIQEIKAFQNNNTINYLRAKLGNEFRFRKFALNNTILYQKVENANNTLNVPEFTIRNTLYFSSHLFKKAMYLQTGVTFNYFTKYYMNAYNPLLAEFYVQTDRKLGEFPRLDFFINAKIRQTRIFLKAEHFNSSRTGYDFYSAPNYPYRDFIVRFGVVWNFFL